MIGGCCPRRLNFLARESLFRGMVGWLIAWFDAIPLQREGLGIGGIKESLRRLRRGELLLIFPEGTRSQTGALQPLEPGFIALARRGCVPIIPVAIDGAFGAWPRGVRYPRPHPIRIVIGPPISTDQIAACSDDALIAEVARRIRECWHEARDRTRQVQEDLPGTFDHGGESGRVDFERLPAVK